MRAHYLQHIPFEGLGSIELWLRASGHEISSTRLFAGETFPHDHDVEFLIVMGGPMGVNDETEYPWLTNEIAFIRDAIDIGKPVLGICLGAQLIAKALGARVYPNQVKEIGWFPVTGCAAEDQSIAGFPASIDVFHWHGETFDLPPGAIRLARSEGCENQAFQIGDTVVGLQFHLETTPDSASAIVRNCRSEIESSEYVQSEAEILGVTPDKYRVINDLMEEILRNLTEEYR